MEILANENGQSLPFMPIDTLEFANDVDRYLEDARRVHPWLARFSQGYVVHGYEALGDFLVDDVNLAPGIGPIVDYYGVRGTMWARFMEELLTSTTGETHDRLRKSVAHAFTPRHANQVRPLMQQVIGGLLDEWAPRGEFDFAQFASYFPVTVMCGLLGVDAGAVPGLRTAIDDHMSSLSMDMNAKPVFLAAWEDLWRFADTVVRDGRSGGVGDETALLGAMIGAANAGGMDETELRFMLLALLIAGYDTSKNQLAVIMLLLLDHPDMYERCATDKAFCGKVVQEALRHTSIATPFREVVRPFVYAGEPFRVGDLLVLAPPLAGRDASVFAEPLRFDPERSNAGRHMAFGRGAHICLGQFIARNQLQEGLHLIAQRLRAPRLNGPLAWRHFLGAWGPAQLPIAFTPA